MHDIETIRYFLRELGTLGEKLESRILSSEDLPDLITCIFNTTSAYGICSIFMSSRNFLIPYV